MAFHSLTTDIASLREQDRRCSENSACRFKRNDEGTKSASALSLAQGDRPSSLTTSRQASAETAPDREIVALIAYLQKLGKVRRKSHQPIATRKSEHAENRRSTISSQLLSHVPPHPRRRMAARADRHQHSAYSSCTFVIDRPAHLAHAARKSIRHHAKTCRSKTTTNAFP